MGAREAVGVDDLVKQLQLQPHPEGGFYRETFRDPGTVTGEDGRERSYSTAILFLLPTGAVSKLHRIRYSEVWHHHLGDPLVVVELTDSEEKRTVLGPRVTDGQQLQHVVPGGRWFGAELDAGSAGTHGYALVGCTVAPGFDFADFEMGERDALLSEFPQHAEAARRLT